MFKKQDDYLDYRKESVRLEKLSLVSLILQICSGISVFIFMLLSLTILQLSGKLKVDVPMLSTASTSEQTAIVDAFNKNMQGINTKVTEVMVRYFIDICFSLHFEPAEALKRFNTNAHIYYMTTYNLWGKVNDNVKPIITKAIENGETITADIKKLDRLASNLWRIRVSLIYYNMATSRIRTEDYIVSIRIGYYPERMIMADTFTNPLGFAVTEFNMNRIKD